MATNTDFSKFRESGELSDLTVAVDGTDFKLHKFPLFIKSDFFRALARTNVVEKDKVELEDFPGGVTTFEQVANYCYNVRIEVNVKNVCKLRCAAEFLQMNTPGNLADAADRLLMDILTTAKLDRDMNIIADLLLQCKELGGISEQAKIVDKCVIAIIDCWQLSTRFSTKSQVSDRWTEDREATNKLFQIPFAWFILLFTTARDKGVRPPVLADLMQSYITHTINSKMTKEKDDGEAEKAKEDSKDTKTAAADNEGTPVDGEETSPDDKTKVETDEKEKDDKKADQSKNEDKAKEEDEDDDDEDGEFVDVQETNEGEKESDTTEQKASVVRECTEDVVSEDVLGDEIVKDLEVAVVLDTLLGELPDNILLTDHISPRWALKVLKVAEANECKCTDQLRKLVGRVVHRLSSDELTQLSADLLAEIVAESCKDDQEGQKEMACTLVDTYLSEMASRDQLTVETFNKMVDAVPSEFRFSHDTLFQVMEALLNSDNPVEEKVKLSDEQKESVLETIDYTRLTETTLRRAYETELVPTSHVTKAALALCSKLRTELEEAHNIIKSQEKELDKYNFRTSSVRHISSSPKRSGKSKYSRDLDSLTSPRARLYDPVISSTTYTPMYTPSSIPTYASESELKLALDTLERSPDHHYDRYEPISYSHSDTHSYRSSLGYGSSYDDRDSLLESEFTYPRSRLSYRGTHDPWPYRY